MKIKSLITVLFCLTVCSGCATPPGLLKDSDYSWGQKTVNANYQEVYRRIVKGFRSCDSIGVAESNLYTDLEEGVFDIYGNGFAGGRSDFVVGTIRLKANGTATNISVGASHIALASVQEKRIKQWLNFAAGDLSCL